MNCDEAREQLVLAAYDELNDDERADLELHLHSCSGCTEESAAFARLSALMATEEMPEISPNLLAASRLRLDEALDEASASTWSMRLRALLVGTWQHLYAAPALATLLVGVGFLGGNLATRYQVSHTPGLSFPRGGITISNEAEGTIGSVKGITPTSDPNVVQVSYERIVPTTFQGNIDEPQVRELLMLAAQKSKDNDLRAESVKFLADQCRAGHQCEHARQGEGTGFRDALLVSLRYDKSAAVRLKALEGLQRYVGEDQRVRDAVLESLMHDSSAEVRTHAIGMLEPVEGDSSVRSVLHTVSTQDANPYIRNASMQALGSVDGLQ